MDCKRFLIIDDNEATRRLLLRHLTAANHSAVAAESAEDGLAWMRHQEFDALLMDDQLPGMTGVSAVSEVRKLAPVPIIIISGSLTRMRYFEALAAGASAFLTKPLDMPVLLSTLERLTA